MPAARKAAPDSSAGGIDRPWAHQVAAAEHAHAGRSVVLATGTASGKSLAYLLPALTAVLDAADGPATACPGVLYLSPTKALAADQLANLTRLQLGPALRPACFDGDTPYAERDWIRSHANYLLTNPDMLHRTLLPGHARWARFLKNLSVVVVDEVALPAGQLRARPTGSAGGHNGLESIIGVLGTERFARLRIGVGRGDPRRDLADHVLSAIPPEIRSVVDDAVIRAADAVECFARDGIEKTMQVFNASPGG